MLNKEEIQKNVNYEYEISSEKLKEIRYETCYYIGELTKHLNM